MRNQPWVQDPDWQRKDPKLLEIAGLPTRLTHTGELAKRIDIMPAGIIIVRGPRQVGKSTFLREFICRCLTEGVKPESIILFDAETFENRHTLNGEIEAFVSKQNGYSVILIDEIASLEKWWLALKVPADAGILSNTLVICTGSSTQDIEEGADLLPGRRGKRHPIDFELLPVRYNDIHSKLTFSEYLLTGGMPWAIAEYLRHKIIPAHVYQLYASWIEGAFLKKSHTASHLSHLLHYITRRMGTPFAVQNLARDSGIGSNSTAETYLTLLERIYALLPCKWSDPQTGIPAARKNRKFYPIDPFLFHVMAGHGLGWESAFERSQEFIKSPALLGILVESVVASELRQRTGKNLTYWIGKKEIDFTGIDLVEVKYQNHVSTAEFEWVHKVIPTDRTLTVLTKHDRGIDGNIRLIPLEEWLLNSSSASK